MTDDLVKRLRAGYCSDNDSDEAADRIEKLETALQEIKALHHEGGVDDLQDRDDMTYSIVWKALEGKDE